MVIFAKTPVALLRMEVTGAFDVGGEIGDERPGAFGARALACCQIKRAPGRLQAPKAPGRTLAALFFLRFRDFSSFSLLAFRPFFVWVAIFSGQPEIATKTKYKYKAIEFPAPFRAYNSIDHLGGGEKHRRPILMLPAL